MKLTCLLMGCMWLGVSAHAANLVQFTAGTPAKAAEVNANFKALNDELTALKSFNNLTAEQIAALKTAVGASGKLWHETTVDCATNPNALVEAHNTLGDSLVWLTINFKGDCYANFNRQFHNYTLMLHGLPEQSARLIPTPANEWYLVGGFNGGLYINNATLTPPTDATAVLFSRSAEGQLSNVTIEGGNIGVLAQANAQLYLNDVKIRNTVHTGLRVIGSADVRFLGNNDGADLVITNEGIGIYVEQASALFASTGIKAPNAVTIHSGGSLATYYENQLRIEGRMNLRPGAQFAASNLELVGSLMMLQADFFAIQVNITGDLRVRDGSSLILSRGQLSARLPSASTYDDYMVLEVMNGSTASLGSYGNNNSLNLSGFVSVNFSSLINERVTLNGDLYAVAGQINLNNSVWNAPGRDPNQAHSMNLNANSTFVMQGSNLAAKSVVLNTSHFRNQGDFSDTDDTKLVANTGTTNFELNFGSSYDANNCAGSGYFNVQASMLRASDCNLAQAVLQTHMNSTLRLDRSKVGLANVDSGSTAIFYQSILTGSGQTSWGDLNYHIGPNSMVYLDGSTLATAKHFHIIGVLRLQNTVDMANSTLFCGPHGYVEWWSQSVVGTIASLGGCLAP